MGQKSISDLNSLTKSELSGSDLLLITDISAKETKNIEVAEFEDYTISKLNSLLTGSFTGSFFGKLYGTSDTSSNSNLSELSSTSSFLIFNGNVNGTASYALTSSNSFYSISASVVESSSYAISSSYSNSSSFANTTSSIRSKNSLYSNYSYNSDTSITSSFINYYGQDNGTVHSSSFSDLSNISDLAEDILDKGSSVVEYALSVNESEFTQTSGTAITSSHSNKSSVAESALTRLFSSLEFRVDTDVTNRKLNVTPLSWKNIKNIAAGNVGNLYTDFYVTYKKRPPFPSNLQDLAYNLSTVTVASFQLNSNNIIKNVSPRNPVPIFTSYVFPCGTDGYVIRFVNCTLYAEQQKPTWFGNITGFFGRDTGRRSSVTNDRGPIYWNIQLDGVIVSAQTFCNTLEFLEVGPPFQPFISQFRYDQDSRFISALKTLDKDSSFINFPATSNILNRLFNWYNNNQQIQYNLIEDVTFNTVKSIAHVSASSYNLLLLENDTYPPFSFGRQIGLVNGKTFYNNSLHYPKTGSSISASIKDVNYLYYNTSSQEYLCVANSKVLYTGSSYINSYTGSQIYGTSLYITELQNLLPIWKYYDTNIQNGSGIGHISNNRYLLLDSVDYNLKNPGSPTGSMPIYIIPDITNQSIPMIQCHDLGTPNSSMIKTSRTIGNDGSNPDIPANPISDGDYLGNQRIVTFDKTIFRKLLVLDTKRAIVIGDNGLVVYSNNIDESLPKWLRIDQLSEGQPNTSELIRNSTEYLVKVNDAYVIYPGSVEIVVISGQDSSKRSCMLSCEVPSSPNDLIVSNWEWAGVLNSFSPVTLDVDSNGNLLPDQIGSSSINTVLRDNKNVIAAGFSTFPTSSYYKYGLSEFYPYQQGLYNTSSVINSIGKLENELYIFGGKNILDIYRIV